MKLTRCENKHFYDSDKYDTCPHCESVPRTAAAALQAEKPSTGSPSKSSHTETLPIYTNANNEQVGDGKTANIMGEFNNHNNVSAPELSAVPVTPMFCGNCGVELRKRTPFCGVCGFKIKLPDTNVSNDNDVTTSLPDSDIDIESAVAAPLDATPESSATLESLQSQVDAVSTPSTTEDMKTMAFYDFLDVEPVVGWFVCVKGEYFGQSFNLKAGQNFIGRALNMDVPLAKDTSVSRNKHAIITYDPQNRVFFIQPGESSGLTYLGDSLLLTHQPINAYEKIKVGNSELILVPCCGEQFTWEDYIQS